MRGKALPHHETKEPDAGVGLSGVKPFYACENPGSAGGWLPRRMGDSGDKGRKGISAFPLIIFHASPTLASLSLSLGNVGFTEPS
jgi:hypothetical protein